MCKALVHPSTTCAPSMCEALVPMPRPYVCMSHTHTKNKQNWAVCVHVKCVHLCVHALMCAGACFCTGLERPQLNICCCPPTALHLVVWERISPVNLESTDWIDAPARGLQGSPCLCTPALSGFLCRCWVFTPFTH